MILSFHPRIQGDINLRLPHRRRFSPEEIQTIVEAKAVILTQHVKADQYAQLQPLGSHLFPDYTHRFGFEGKVGNTRLFRLFRAPHPETRIYASVPEFKKRHLEKAEPLFDFPFVLKGDRGGGGWAVFLIRNNEELILQLDRLADPGRHPSKCFIAQEYVHHNGQDLRVVALGDIYMAYWRCQEQPGEFRNNVGRGAVIRYDLDPARQKAGMACVRNFCKGTGINLAAFDVLFDRNLTTPTPLLSEINFLFGRKGLGGSPRFHAILKDAVAKWLDTL